MLPPHDISVRAIQKRLCENHLVAHVAQKKNTCERKNRRRRYGWAKEHLGWSNSRWTHVLFSDESKIQRISGRGLFYLRCGKNEKYRFVVPDHLLKELDMA